MTDNTNALHIGVTFQLTLDTFLNELHPHHTNHHDTYQAAIEMLKEIKRYRNPKTKKEIAQKAFACCPNCIEARLALGRYHHDVYERVCIYKEGMEFATMELGKDFFQQNIQDFYMVESALPLLHIKYAYACTLYEVGYMKKAVQQFKEILHVNPSDHFNVHYYLFALYVYFEEFISCRDVLQRFPEDAFQTYTLFLLYVKEGELELAKSMIPLLKSKNKYLYDMLTYKTMHIAIVQQSMEQGSREEANYIYRILIKAIQPQECLHIFLNQL